MEQSQESKVNEVSEQQATPAEEAKQTEAPQKTFTQEELDKIIADRIARERKKYEKYADYDDLKNKLARYEKEAEERRLAEMSEKERAEELARMHAEEKEQLARELEELRKEIREKAIQSEFYKLANKYKITYVDDAYRLADLSGVEVEGNEIKGLEDAVKALAESKPFLLAPEEPRTIGRPSNPSTSATSKTAEQLLAAAREKARSGDPHHMAEYSRLKRELGVE